MTYEKLNQELNRNKENPWLVWFKYKHIWRALWQIILYSKQPEGNILLKGQMKVYVYREETAVDSHGFVDKICLDFKS